MKTLLLTFTLSWGLLSALTAQSVATYCTDFSIPTNTYNLYRQVTDSITVVVNFSGATVSAVANPQVDITLTNNTFIDFPDLPYVYPGNVGPGPDSFTFTTQVSYTGTPPNGTQVTGNFSVYKSIPNPPYFLFVCQYPVTFTILDPVGIDPNTGQETISLYPNPVQNEVRVKGATETTLFDALGRPIAATSMQSADMTVWQIEHLPTGIYWIRGIDVDGRHFSRPFVKVVGQ